MRSIAARVGRSREVLAVGYVVEGDIARLSQGGEPLWRHTCCELFVGPHGSPGYREFNLSPQGKWAAYAFERYRERAQLEIAPPQVAVRAGARTLEMEIRVSAAGKLRIGLSAVIEEDDGALSYWALRHPPGKPDFHHADAFALEFDENRD